MTNDMEAGLRDEEPRSSGSMNSQADPETKPDEISDGGYGWVVVATVFWNNAHTWGISPCYAVFLAYYLKNSTFPSATPLDFAFIGSLHISQALLVAPLAANITRLYGANASMLCGVFCETMALIGASLSKQIWHLYLSFGICLGWGIGLQYIATVGIVPQWFNRRRALASGIGAAGSGTGGLICTLATNAMINRFGISWTYGILCIIQFVVNTTCALLICNRNCTVGTRQVAINKTLFRRPEYWLLLSWGFLSILEFEVLLFCLPDYANSIGLTAQQGTVAAALLNLGRGVGRPAIRYFSDGVGRINMASIMSLICGLLCLAMWISAKDYGALLAFPLFGGVTGIFWTVAAPIAIEVVALQDLPSCLTMMWMVLVCPAAFAAPIALQLRKLGRPNGYLNAQLLAGFMFLGAGVSCFLLRIWKIRQQDETEIEIVHHNAALRPYDEMTPITALPMSQLAFHDDSTIRGKCLDSLHLSFSLRKV